jgi:hypothetical protein
VRALPLLAAAVVVASLACTPRECSLNTSCLLPDTNPSVASLADVSDCEALVFGKITIDESSPCTTDGWPNYQPPPGPGQTRFVMEQLFPATVDVEWTPSKRPIDATLPVLALFPGCDALDDNWPTTTTEGFFKLEPFDLAFTSFYNGVDWQKVPIETDIAEHPYSITCNGQSIARGWRFTAELVTADEIATKKPAELSAAHDDDTVDGAKAFFDARIGSAKTGPPDEHCPTGDDVRLVGSAVPTPAACRHQRR